MYDAIHNTLPTPLSFLYIPNSTVHSHNTRQRHEPHVQARRSMVATNSFQSISCICDDGQFLVRGGNKLGEMFHKVLLELTN